MGGGYSNGVRFGCRGNLDVALSITDSAHGINCGLGFTTARDLEAFQLELHGFGNFGSRKYLTSTEDEGTSFGYSSWGMEFALSNKSRKKLRFFNGSGDYVFGFASETVPSFGFVRTTLTPRVDIGGETFDAGEGVSSTKFRAGTATLAKMEIRPWGSGLAIEPYLGFEYGTEYSGNKEDRLRLALLGGLQLGYSEAEKDGTEDPDLGWWGFSYGVYLTVLGGIQRAMINDILSNRKQALEDYEIISGSEDIGSLEDVPLLEGAMPILGALGKPKWVLSTGEASIGPLNGYWMLGGLQLARGILSMPLGGDANIAAGTADILGTARLAMYSIWDIETPALRAAKGYEAVRDGQHYVNLISSGLNFLVLAIGNFAGSDIAVSGATSALLSNTISPDPIDWQRDSYSSTAYGITYMPGEGARAAIKYHTDWDGMPVFSQGILLTDQLISPFSGGNYTTARATLGYVYRFGDYGRVYVGGGGSKNSGAPEGHEGSLDVTAGADFMIPVYEKIGFTGGAQAFASLVCPDFNFRSEFGGFLGVGGTF